VLTGKAFGKDESHVVVGSFVTSRTNGAVEKVPIARNWPESWKSSTVIEVGMMLSEVIDSSEVPVPLIVTETVALAVTTEPSVFVY
jgi:hypothetical protein